MALAAGTQAAASPTFDAQRMSQDVREISSDAYQGREPATPGETKTINFLIAQYQAAGLQPGGDLAGAKGSAKRRWTQDVPLGRYEFSGPLAVSVSDGKNRTSLRQGEDIAIRAVMNGERKIDLRNIPLVFVGYGVNAPERNWDDFKGEDLKGKLAVVLINDPDFEGGEGDFGGKTMTYYGRWTYKFEEMARRGAVGTIIVHETAPAAYGWPTVKNSNTNTMYDIVRKQPGQAHALIESWIQRDAAVDMFKRAGLDFETARKSAQLRAFKPMPLTGVTLSARFAVKSRVITTKNVIGLVPGTSRAGEHVMYSAHWDHLGVAAPDAKGDRIYNGAGDNGSGIAALLELARAYGKAPRPQRSVLFVAFTAEERGLLGSEYYAANPVFPLATTAGLINMDNLNPMGLRKNFTISGSARLDLLDRLIENAKARDVAFTPEPRPEAGGFFRSDHFPMAKRGVPAISFKAGDEWAEGGLTAGQAYAKAYTANDYHQPSDEWRAEWTFAGTARDLEFLYATGRELADGGSWPNWAQDSEFRAARDASAAQRK